MRLRRALAGLIALGLLTPALQAQVPPDQQADMLFTSARKAQSDGNLPFAIQRYGEFLQKFGNHPRVNEARVQLAGAIAREDLRQDPRPYLLNTASNVTAYLTGFALGGRPWPDYVIQNRSRPVALFRTWLFPGALMLIELFAALGLYRARHTPVAPMLALIFVLTMAAHAMAVPADARYVVMIHMPLCILALSGLASSSAPMSFTS